MDDAVIALTRVAMLTFVVASMLSMGMSLTTAAILGPLRDVRLVALTVLVNFVLVPAAVVPATRLLPMEDAAAVSVVVLACCAGAPFLPTLARLAHGDQALSVGVMVLLMVLTVAYVPLVVPLVVAGDVEVSAGPIARSLVVLMLLPLAAGLALRARHPGLAASWAPHAGTVGTVGMGLGLAGALTAGWRDVLASAGSWIFLGTLLVVLVGLLGGYVAGVGRPGPDRVLLGLGTAQRNVSAALVVAASLSPDVVVRTVVAAIVLPAALLLVAAEVGRRSPVTAT